MRFQIEDNGRLCRLHVFIDYKLSKFRGWPDRWDLARCNLRKMVRQADGGGCHGSIFGETRSGLTQRSRDGEGDGRINESGLL